MPDVKWIKIVTDIFDDEKILLIESMPDADSVIVIWFKLLCLAGRQNNSGVFLMNGRIPYTDEMFSTIFRRPLNTVRMALTIFEQYGMIEIINNTVTIPNWSKHQNLDRIEAKNEYMKNYMRQYREKQKALAAADASNKPNCKANSESYSKANVSIIDKNREEQIREDKNRGDKRGTSASRFTPPTVEEVTAYAKEKKWESWQFNPERFVDFYASKGWKVGKDSMKDWKAAARGWVSRSDVPPSAQVAPNDNPQLNYKQREYREEDFGDDYFVDLDNIDNYKI